MSEVYTYRQAFPEGGTFVPYSGRSASEVAALYEAFSGHEPERLEDGLRELGYSFQTLMDLGAILSSCHVHVHASEDLALSPAPYLVFFAMNQGGFIVLAECLPEVMAILREYEPIITLALRTCEFELESDPSEDDELDALFAASEPDAAGRQNGHFGDLQPPLMPLRFTVKAGVANSASSDTQAEVVPEQGSKGPDIEGENEG